MRRLRLAALACFAAGTAAQSPQGVAWYDSDIDPSFAAATVVPGWRRLYEGSGNEHGVAIAHTADGGFVVAARLGGGGAGARIGLFRLDNDGNYVTSGFGTGGKVFKDAWLADVTDMAIDAQGRIVVIGPTPGTGGAYDVGVVRFKPDGSDDASFGGDGGVGIPVVAGGVDWDVYPTSLLIEADGRIVVAATAHQSGGPSRFAVLRVQADGALDTGFGDFSGITISSYGDDDATAEKILPIADGHYLVVGTQTMSDTDTDFGARILRPGGGTWAGATGAATFLIDAASTDGTHYDNARAAALASPTSVVIAGTASGRFAATRVKVDGTGGQYTNVTWDVFFIGHPGSGLCIHCYVSGYTNQSEVAAVGVRSDGRIVIAGTHRSTDNHEYGLVSRLRANGDIDTGWVSGIVNDTSKAAPTSDGEESFITGFTDFLFDDGRMVATGSAVDSTSAETDYDAFIMRFRSDLIFANRFE